ncbi:unnamed protein product [Dracunculus medinensis]|uniref:Uncharacterized protein n=1 Tax=Dracunculus medinensis TaxID=318479 RepID=A0A0N4UPP9_DRAME|nr:unnamed protein product [Dracunculus medinensis]
MRHDKKRRYVASGMVRAEVPREWQPQHLPYSQPIPSQTTELSEQPPVQKPISFQRTSFQTYPQQLVVGPRAWKVATPPKDYQTSSV